MMLKIHNLLVIRNLEFGNADFIIKKNNNTGLTCIFTDKGVGKGGAQEAQALPNNMKTFS